jgi:hypothetical protein
LYHDSIALEIFSGANKIHEKVKAHLCQQIKASIFMELIYNLNKAFINIVMKYYIKFPIFR